MNDDEEYAKFVDSLCPRCETETKVQGYELCSKCHDELLQITDSEPDDNYEYDFLPEDASYEELIAFEERQNNNQINEYYCVLKDMMPVRTINTHDDNKESCVICLLSFQAGDKVCKFPCKHEFHTECIYPWLQKNTLCPCCKFDSKNTLDLKD